jgi:hypothetical protein
MLMVPTSTGWPFFVQLLDLLEPRPGIFPAPSGRWVRMVDADHGLVGGDDHHVQLVDLGELLGLGVGGTGHAGQLVIHAEIVLEGDGGQGLVLAFRLTPSLASRAWCRPSLKRRPGMSRPVNSSTITTWPSLTM